MHVGVFHFPTEYAIDVRELATALEARGYESLFVCEHTHIPSSRRTPFPSGGELPRRYSNTFDPFVALSFAAGVTQKLKLATGIALMSQRDPIVTAKVVASLDQFSGGRVIFGIGAGWNAEEMENHGTRFETRFKVMRERVLAMKALWTQEEAAYQGEFVNLSPSRSNPKPKQRPHPPIILGGETDHTLQRVMEFCDGWFPRVRGPWNPAEAMTRMRRAAEAAKRDPASISVTVFGAPMDAAHLDACRKAGIDRVLFHAPDQGRDDVLRILDQNMAALRA
ncbi:MAG: LLM class F420-dependent oxidoreductase [Betaproteobacteria bacterium]|nr:LLM class F420-dependent oxidoreductase [Betaproteobacteria bacterium]